MHATHSPSSARSPAGSQPRSAGVSIATIAYPSRRNAKPAPGGNRPRTHTTPPLRRPPHLRCACFPATSCGRFARCCALPASRSLREDKDCDPRCCPRGAQGLRRSPDYVRGLCPGSPGRVRSVAPRAVVQGVRGAESRLLWSNVSATEAASSQQRRGIWNDAQRPKCKVFRLGCCHGTPPPPLTADAPARRRKVLRSRVLPRGQVLFRAVASRHGAQPRWHGAQSAPLLRSSPHAAQTNTLLCPLSSSQSVPAALR